MVRAICSKLSLLKNCRVTGLRYVGKKYNNFSMKIDMINVD